MKKIFVSLFIASIALVTSVKTAYAGQCTSLLDIPELKAGEYTNGSAYTLASSYATATGANANAYFYNYGTLSTSFAADNDRFLNVYLMEKDGVGSDDDQVKVYAGIFSGRTLTEIRIIGTLISGNIEAEGDHKSELYGRFNITKRDGDPTTKTRSFLDYQLCQD